MNNSNRICKAVCFFLLISSVLFATGQEEKIVMYTGTEGKITVYASGPAEMLNKLEESFENEHGDVLDFVHMGCGPLRQRVWTEFETGTIKADVFWGADPLLYNALDEQGALETFKPANLDMVKEEFLTEHNYFFVNERYGVVIYNKEKLTGDAVPESFHDLLNPFLECRIVHADPAQSSTALALVAGLWELVEQPGSFHLGLIENGLFLAKKNSDVPSKIQEGEFDAGIAPHDAVLRLQKKAQKEGYPTPLAIAWPEEGALAIQRPVAISTNDARPEVNYQIACDFVDFLLSRQVQTITMQFGFISVRKDVQLPGGVPEELNKLDLDWDILSEKQDEIREGFNGLF